MSHLLTLLRRRWAYANRVRRLAPIAYWPLWENSGTTALDWSGNGRTGTYTGVDLAQPGFGDGRTAPLFDGINDVLNVAGASLTSLNGAFSGSAGTICLWLRVASAGVWTDATNRFTFRVLVDANNFVRIIKTSTSNQLQWTYRAGGTSSNVNKTTSGPAGNVHVAITWDKAADQMKAYYNGVQEGATQTGLGTWAGSLAAVTIGAQDTSPSAVWSGVEGHIAIFSRALTADQVASLARMS